jgi:hypothetical protein
LQVGIHAALREYDVAKQVPIVRGRLECSTAAYNEFDGKWSAPVAS